MTLLWFAWWVVTWVVASPVAHWPFAWGKVEWGAPRRQTKRKGLGSSVIALHYCSRNKRVLNYYFDHSTRGEAPGFRKRNGKGSVSSCPSNSKRKRPSASLAHMQRTRLRRDSGPVPVPVRSIARRDPRNRSTHGGTGGMLLDCHPLPAIPAKMRWISRRIF